jgi:hypothetical protein
MVVQVVCLAYDLSRGMARSLGRQLVGLDIEGVWHTGIEVFGHEYFFGGGIQAARAGEFARENDLQPVQRFSVGSTAKSQAELHAWLETQRVTFSAQTYDLLRNNCNNFSDAVARFLTGQGIPGHILELPQRVLSTPMGQMLAPMYERMQQDMLQHPHMIPFGNAQAPLPLPAPVGAPPAGAPPAVAGAPASAPAARISRAIPEGLGVELQVKVASQESNAKVRVASLDASVLELMEAIQDATGYAVADQRVIFKGSFLREKEKKLSEHGISPQVVIHLVPKPGAKPIAGAGAPAGEPAAGAGAPAPAPAPSKSPLEACLERMARAPEAERLTALRTLQKVVQNVVDMPLEARYRRIKRGNPALAKRLDPVDGAFDCLLALGFSGAVEDGEQLLVVEADEEAWVKIVMGNARLKAVIAALEAPAPAPVQPPPMPIPFGAPFGAPFGSPFGPGQAGPPLGGADMASLMSNPMVQQRMQQIMSDPTQIQAMFDNPMVRQMTQSNPAMAAAMANPERVSQMFRDPMVQQLMSNPAMMQQVMGQAQAALGRPAAAPGGQQQQQQQQQPRDDTEMTEEEMMQEAIRRSLQER